jgi:hypothetical protein
MEEAINQLAGANMDIDLTSGGKVLWNQDECPWNIREETLIHRCAVKNVSICPYFCGIAYIDRVLCCYPNKNPNQ